MRAKDIMTRQVRCLPRDASIFDAARLLLNSHASAAPVVDTEGKLVGIVSEADLIHRVELGTERHRSLLLRVLRNDTAAASDYIRSHTRRVSDVMTTNVVTASEDSTLGEIADLMDRHHIKRIPIVRDGKPVGIVSRANLLQGLMAYEPTAAETTVDDNTIRESVTIELARNHSPSMWPLTVIVEQGVVHLWGYAPTETAKKAFRVTVERVAGVRRIEDHLALLSEAMAFDV
ncbi:MAG TPA: CBS domain-containing protein [Vineibacter sp.]|nr:CBS domain-containing protein [Vineibacter sp.]